MHSPDGVQENLLKLRTLYPNLVSEASDHKGQTILVLDKDQLRQEFSGSIVEGPQERYRLDWPGKREAIAASNAPTSMTLRPLRQESVNFDTTNNLFLEGDNLHILKLLRDGYVGQIDLIYIDPPYNTGEDFIYRDDFSLQAEEYLIRSQDMDEEGNRFTANIHTNGRFHSDWLSMMYSRLKIARLLLSDSGSIFISIDDEEQDNLKKICDEIFGEENFINTIAVNMKSVAGASGGGEDKRLKKNIEFLHIYVRSKIHFHGFNNVHDLFPLKDWIEKYRIEGKSWKYTSALVDAGDKTEIGSTKDGDGNEIKIFARNGFKISSITQLSNETGKSKEEIYKQYRSQIFSTTMPQSSIRVRVRDFLIGNGGINSDLYSIEYVPKSGRHKGQLYEQFYKGEKLRLFAWLRDVTEEKDGVVYRTEKRGTYWDCTSEMNNLSKEGDVQFQNGKKPLAMIKRIVEMYPSKDFTVLDFFAGSSTTAHAVLAANAEDGGNRKFVMVQLPEECGIDKTEFENVADLSKERIRRAGKQILENHTHPDWNRDVGFRMLKLDTSNLLDVYYAPDSLDQLDLLNAVDNIKPNRTELDLLFQVMLDWGMSLSSSIERVKILDSTVFLVESDNLIGCFAQSEVTEKLVQTLAARKPLRMVFRDGGFHNDSAKINAGQIVKQLSPSTELKTI